MATVTPPAKLNFKLFDIIRAALGLAMIDGGFVIAIQIISFLLKYFGSNIQLNAEDTSSIAGVSKAAFLVSIISILNLAVIIYRVTGLARGMKYSAATCYQQAIRRWPILIILFICAGMLLLFTALPVIRSLNVINASIDYNRLFLFSVMLLIPYGLLTCIFVVDQERNPLQAVIATFKTIKLRVSLRLMFNIALLYALPFVLGSSMMNNSFAPYIGLFNSLWFLFCHMLIIVVYAGATIANQDNVQKPSKVLIV